MTTELFIPDSSAKITRHSEYYRASETFKRRSAASKIKARNRWARPGERERSVCKKLAKPVDAFDLDGNFIATFPSSRKAAQSLWPDNWVHRQDTIRQCRRGMRKQCLGYMFRDHQDGVARIEPYRRKKRVVKKGYTKDNSYLHKPVRVTWPDGDTLDFESVKDAADAFHIRASTVSTYLHNGKPWNGKKIELIETKS